jgi:hypothetical protein
MKRIHVLGLILGVCVVASPAAQAATATAAKSAGTIKSANYPLPEYTNTKLPPITSCDPKAEAAAAIATGNAYIDSVTSVATTLTNAYKKKEEDEFDEDAIDGSASIDTKCEEPLKLNIDEKIAEKLSCEKLGNEGFIEQLKAENEEAKKRLACSRGVLAAINGELTCFKKQITAAQAYMNELINNPGGLNAMLTMGVAQMSEIDKEVGDREAQLKELTRRLEDPKNGMGAAKEALDKLSSEIPLKQTAVENDIQDVRAQQARFETLVKQATMGKTMECLQRSTPGYRCVKSGGASKRYSTGNVSPMEYMRCLYAQSANKIAGGKIVTNSSLEDARLSQVDTTLKGLSVPTSPDMPAFSDQKGFEAAMRSYQINTPEQLIAAFGSITSAADKAVGKSVSGQFRSDVTRCYQESVAQASNERSDQNTNIGVNSYKLAQFAKGKASGYASEMRKLKSTYEQAVKSATGQSVQLNTSRCEKESLENQGKCLDALGAMVDAILTGDGTAAQTKLVGPAASLTAGQPPINGFISELKAPANPARTIANIECKGLTDCVAKYENLKVELSSVVEERKQRKESMKSEINQKMVTIAQQIASGKDPKTGAIMSTNSLNQVSALLSGRKEQLIQAMKRMKVEGSLELDPEKVGDTDIDEKSGLYKANDLRNLVLGAIDPKMLANDEKGFAAASNEIKKRDDDLEGKQQKLDAFIEHAESAAAACVTAAKKGDCERRKGFVDEVCQQRTQLSDLLRDAGALAEATGQTIDPKKIQEKFRQTGENSDSEDAPESSEAQCGRARESYRTTCIDKVSENEEKDLNNMGSKKTGVGKKAGKW